MDAKKDLETRYWGAKLSKVTAYGLPYFLVSDYRGIALVSGRIRYHLGLINAKLLYRGQARDYRLVPSLFRPKPPAPPQPPAENLPLDQRKAAVAWLNNALESIQAKFDRTGDPIMRAALAQHYGLKTNWLDVLDSFQMAAWFACDTGKAIGIDDQGDGHHADSVGYIYLIAVPESDAEESGLQWIDLRRKPSNWLRPHVQQAFCVSWTNPLSHEGKFDNLVVCVFVVPRTLLFQWSGMACITRSHVYPGAGLDEGVKYWANAVEELRKRGIAGEPPHLMA